MRAFEADIVDICVPWRFEQDRELVVGRKAGADFAAADTRVPDAQQLLDFNPVQSTLWRRLALQASSW